MTIKHDELLPYDNDFDLEAWRQSCVDRNSLPTIYMYSDISRQKKFSNQYFMFRAVCRSVFGSRKVIDYPLSPNGKLASNTKKQ